MNPDIANANFESNSGYTKYDSLQIDATKRMSHGLLLQGGYVYGNAYQSDRYSLQGRPEAVDSDRAIRAASRTR